MACHVWVNNVRNTLSQRSDVERLQFPMYFPRRGAPRPYICRCIVPKCGGRGTGDM
ncbi:MAG: hypothetical protein HDS16_00275 [Bacteroides sp.]|nr:hypothetical protein [Bacteroides sp.]